MTTLTIPRQTVPRNEIAGLEPTWNVPNTVDALDAELGLSPTDFALFQLLPGAIMDISLDPMPHAFTVSVSVTGPEMSATLDQGIVRYNQPTAAEVQRLRDWLLADSLDWDTVERARYEAWR